MYATYKIHFFGLLRVVAQHIVPKKITASMFSANYKKGPVLSHLNTVTHLNITKPV